MVLKPVSKLQAASWTKPISITSGPKALETWTSYGTHWPWTEVVEEIGPRECQVAFEQDS